MLRSNLDISEKLIPEHDSHSHQRTDIISPCSDLSTFAPSMIFASVLFLLVTIIPLTSFAVGPESPFGVMLNFPHYPNSTMDDYLTALKDVRAAGDFSGFIWHWDKQDNLDARLRDIGYLKEIGLKSIVQISVGVLGKPTPPAGYVRSFSDPDTRQLYLSNIQSIAEAHPDYLVLATEINFMTYWMPEEWELFVQIYKEAAGIIREISPQTKIGVSFHYGMFIWQKQFSLLDQLGDYDFAAITSYPSWLVAQGYYDSVEDISPDWYGIIRTLYPDLPILISEAGWSSRGLSNPDEQRRYIENLPRLVSKLNPELICYVFAYDVNYFNPQWINYMSEEERERLDSLGVDLSLLFDRFNNMGLKYTDGTPKPAWAAALSLNSVFQGIEQ